MATFADLQASPVTKMLLLGDSGSGKTGAVMSLIAAGYNVRVLDLDNGVQILADYFTNPASIYIRAREGLWTQAMAAGIKERFHYETLTDRMKSVGGKLIPGKATVWQRATGLLDKWGELGPISSWGPKDVLVIDSLTFISKAAMNLVLAMNNRLGSAPQMQDWGQAQQAVEGLLQQLYDEGVNCNVIVNCHLKMFGPEGGSQRWFPETLGKALSPNIGRYFNTMLLAKTVGVGTKERRVISTQSAPSLELKTTCPLRVKPEYDLATGLAEYFAAERAGSQSTTVRQASVSPPTDHQPD